MDKDAPGPQRLPRDLGIVRNAMKVAEVAEMLQVSQRHVYKLVADGEIPFFKVGEALRFDPCLLADWLKDRMSAHPGLPAMEKKLKAKLD